MTTPLAMPVSPATGEVPYRHFGETGAHVSLLGLGGSALGSLKRQSQAVRLVHHALDAGINFIDNAWEYHDGRSEEWVGAALKGRREKAFLMTKVCTHGRGAAVALRQLEESLKRLQTDYLDLWQIHEVIYDNEPELYFAGGGAIEALVKAKEQGKVRFIGFTGHKDPAIHLRMLSNGFPFDSCQLPLNPFDASFRSFERRVLPELNRQGIAAIAMKSLGGTAECVKQRVITAAEALRYVMSLPIATVVSGIDSIDVLHRNLEIVQSFEPMTPREAQDLRDRCAEYAADGHFELYKTSKIFDGSPGREQHGFPEDRES